MSSLRVAVSQMKNRVGDLDSNARDILDAMQWAEEQDADVLVLPEMCLPGYSPQDLVERRGFVAATNKALADIALQSKRVTTVVGTFGEVPPTSTWDTRKRSVSIAAAVINNGEVRGYYHKTLVPMYEVFAEARCFATGNNPSAVWQLGESTVGISICEDLWADGGGVSPPDAQAVAGAQLLLIPNASPFYPHKSDSRVANTARVARRTGLPAVYVNSVGGQDELVFDGGSFAVDANGHVLHVARRFETDRFCLDVPLSAGVRHQTNATIVHPRRAALREPLPAPEPVPELPTEEQLWRALVTGTRDFVQRNGATQVVLPWWWGVSTVMMGAVAAAALGPENVLGVMMPGGSMTSAEWQVAQRAADNLRIECLTIPVGEVATNIQRSHDFLDPMTSVAEPEALTLSVARQAMLLSVANRTARIPLATGNKTAVSASLVPLHAGMTGTFAPLRDCFLSTLYALAEYLNSDHELIPSEIVETRSAPFAAIGLTCDEIDPILRLFLEEARGLDEIVTILGVDPEMARGILQLVDDAEMYRRQAPPGLNVSRLSDRRVPLTNEWRPHQLRIDESSDEAGSQTQPSL